MSRAARKRARPVLRGRRRGNAPPLPDEIFFSIVQRKALTPNDFTDLTQVEQRLLDFQDRYNATAAPFRWKFTAADLAEVIARIDRHETTPPPPAPKKPRATRRKPATTPEAA